MVREGLERGASELQVQRPNYSTMPPPRLIRWDQGKNDLRLALDKIFLALQATISSYQKAPRAPPRDQPLLY